jgi:hypothetical protein
MIGLVRFSCGDGHGDGITYPARLLSKAGRHPPHILLFPETDPLLPGLASVLLPQVLTGVPLPYLPIINTLRAASYSGKPWSSGQGRIGPGLVCVQ